MEHPIRLHWEGHQLRSHRSGESCLRQPKVAAQPDSSAKRITDVSGNVALDGESRCESLHQSSIVTSNLSAGGCQ